MLSALGLGRSPYGRIRRSGLFDEQYYLNTYPDVRAAGIEPLAHYIEHGASEGRNPSSRFQTTYYVARYREEIDPHLHPLLDFILHGQKQQRYPTALAELSVFLRKSRVFESAQYASHFSESLGVDPIERLLQVELRNRSISDTDLEIWRFFDARYYLDSHREVSGSGLEPIDHYLQVGASERRNPSLFFDTEYYLACYPDVAESKINPLAHYIVFGRPALRSPSEIVHSLELLCGSGLFDKEYYLSVNPDVRNARLDPVEHFLTRGLIEGRDPSAEFDTAYYVSKYGDVIPPHLPPVLHYIVQGRAAGMLPRRRRVVAPQPPSEESWRALLEKCKARGGGEPSVDVIVPVYGEADVTLNCLHSVLVARQVTEFELVVIDDCGPDPVLSEKLSQLSAGGLFTLIRNSDNQGFVATANLGIALHPTRDVVLLNSDTEVHNDWLDRILALARGGKKIGTITPFSNNATICSYPTTLKDNQDRLELTDAELDLIAADVNCSLGVDIPTAVGFCMYIARSCILDVGVFDAVRFGRGYGEENDFCLRAANRGWRNLLATNVFVRHFGGVSFGGERAGRLEAALKMVTNLHPDYLERVAQYVAADPARMGRVRMDLQRLSRETKSLGPTMLFLTSDRGGGTERHVREMQARLRQEGVRTLVLKWDNDCAGLLRFADSDMGLFPNISAMQLPHDLAIMIEVLTALDVRHIHVHHLAASGDDAPRLIEQLSKARGIDYDASIHDYLMVCPRINMIDGSGVYCGEPDLAGCETCIARWGSEFGKVSVASWRTRFEAFLSGARRVFVPDADVANRMKRHFPSVNFVVRPHITHIGPVHRAKGALRRPHRRKHVAIIGAILSHKGSLLLLQCAKSAWEQGAPITFFLIGYSDIDERLRHLPNVVITGRYAEANVQNLLRRYDCDIAWFPSVWPEAFSYTLSIALDAGLFPVAFDLGAPAQRIRTLGWGELMPISLLGDAKAVLETLLAIEPRPASLAVLEAARIDYADLMRDYYGLDIEWNSGARHVDQAAGSRPR